MRLAAPTHDHPEASGYYVIFECRATNKQKATYLYVVKGCFVGDIVQQQES